ncbi:MAG: methyl-accepting chemotaxis protein, partial [Deltaproteobacteria bacterium]|nr:methyl-accepting chemotaxis protein [Deltaproteobacteria bacterium]
EKNMALLKEVSRGVDMYADLSARKTTLLIITQIAVFFISITIAVIGLMILTRIIVRPIGRIVGLAQAVAAGDLTALRLNFKNRDEMGTLCGALNKMKDNLNVIINNIRMTSSDVADTAVHLSSYSTRIVRGAENQSSQTIQVAGAMEEMSATVVEIARNSHAAAESARSAQDTAVNGGEVVSRAVQGMMTVAATVKSSAATIETLGKSSEEIGGIVTVINDIADQTNLLALNAAIEAARAGEQGRGFAVVADEVGKLAEKTAQATKQIADMIETIQNDTRGVMASMNEGTRQAESGVQLANDAGEALRQIVSSVQNVTHLVSLIATAAEEQRSTTDSMATSVTGIADVAKETLDGIKQISTASENLSAVSAKLQDIIGAFRLDKEETVQKNAEIVAIEPAKSEPFLKTLSAG